MGKIEVEESLILDSLVKRRSTVISGKQSAAVLEKNEKRDTLRKISIILRKTDAERSADDSALLNSAPALVKHARKLQDRLDKSKKRLLEQEDPHDVIDQKAQQLADWLSHARHLVCYTGAGISTAARIPDYRGTNGIWTRLQKGESIGQHDLSQAEPTFTHMALYELHRQRILQYVLSQNCDGLHLRSGLPRESLSEVHGNMYVEVCKACKPNREYLRVFDTTELTARYCHKTNRQCRLCGEPLVDTIVHFGERGSLQWPLNWDGASRHAERADVILCLGSSLKVLKKYSWLWQMDRPRLKRPKLCIVNLQWTPKDAFADLKVNGKCDVVMEMVMKYMGLRVRGYSRLRDPIFAHATLLTAEEEHTVTQPMLKWENEEEDDDDDEQTTVTEETTEAETMSDAADGEGDDDETFEEEEGNFDEDGCEEMDVRLAGELDTDSEDGDTESERSTVDIKPEIADESKYKLKLGLIDSSENGVKDIKMEPTLAEPYGAIKKENGDALKSEHDLMHIDSKLPELPDELLANGAGFCDSPVDRIKTEAPTNGASDRNRTTPPPNVILISDSDESLSSASATTYFSSAESTTSTPQPAVPTTTTANRPFAQQSQQHPKALIAAYVPPPPVPFFNTSPLGLRTISPQRKAPATTTTTTTTTPRQLQQSPIKLQTSKSNNSTTNVSSALAVRRSTAAPAEVSTAISTSTSAKISCSTVTTSCTATVTNPGHPSSSTRLPYWYEPNYVYAGLHTIVHPPPGDVHLFRTATKSVLQLDRTRADCDFCFDAYAEIRCLFYQPLNVEHKHAKRTRSGRPIVCECCTAATDGGDGDNNGGYAIRARRSTATIAANATNDYQTSRIKDEDVDETGAQSASGNEADMLLENTDDSGEAIEPSLQDKRSKLDETAVAASAAGSTPVGRIQPGWYGKGYRKSRRRR